MWVARLRKLWFDAFPKLIVKFCETYRVRQETV